MSDAESPSPEVLDPERTTASTVEFAAYNPASRDATSWALLLLDTSALVVTSAV